MLDVGVLERRGVRKSRYKYLQKIVYFYAGNPSDIKIYNILKGADRTHSNG